jgi:hypothetical protein
MNMNKAVATGIGLGIDGQTQAYMTAKGKLAKDIFSSKYVPMTDGYDLLTSCPQRLFSQKGYGNIPSITPAKVPTGRRIGFDNTLVSTATGEGIKVSCATTKTYANHSVTSDFPKGPGGVAPAPMWEDGTYDEMIGAIKKRHTGLPEGVNFMAPPDIRKDVFNLQALTGASVYGNALVSQEIAEGFAKEKKEIDISKLSVLYPEATYRELAEASTFVDKEKRIAENARKLGISLDRARQLDEDVERTLAKQNKYRNLNADERAQANEAYLEAVAQGTGETQQQIEARLFPQLEPTPGFRRQIETRRTREKQERILKEREAEEKFNQRLREKGQSASQRLKDAILEFAVNRRDTKEERQRKGTSRGGSSSSNSASSSSSSGVAPIFGMKAFKY